MIRKRVLVFAGTSEGRELALWLCENGFFARICVASQYGADILQKALWEMPAEAAGQIEITAGRLEEAEMEEILQNESFLAVVDATHPYAVVVSGNIKAAAQKENVEVMRLARGAEDAPLEMHGNRLLYAADAREAAHLLRDMPGTIFLTTGSKDIGIFAEQEDVRRRLIARVLPTEESVRLCMAAGLPMERIVTGKGPFTEEENIEQLVRYNAAVLVTKNSGSRGGVPEKLAAAGRLQLDVVCIASPETYNSDSLYTYEPEEVCTFSRVQEKLLRLR